MARTKKKEEVKGIPEMEIPDLAKAEETETDNLVFAEKLQKAGWQLISVTQTSNGKLYKFKR